MHNMSVIETPEGRMVGIVDAAYFLGVAIETLRRWSRKGKLKTFRKSPHDPRLFLETDIVKIKEEREQNKVYEEKPEAIA